MDIKKRLNKIEKIAEDHYKEETPNIFMKNITDLIEKGYNKMIQEIIRKAKV